MNQPRNGFCYRQIEYVRLSNPLGLALGGG